MMEVGGENSVTPSTGQEVAEDDALLALRRIDRGDKAQPSCWALTEPATCSAEMVSRAANPSTAPMNAPRRASQASDRTAQIELIVVAMERQQHHDEHERDGEAQTHRR
jgi:hypothetical protein